jgi:hypothetical protein
MDILIYAKPEIIEHKMERVMGSKGYCYWTCRLPAFRYRRDIRFVMFSDGDKIYAAGKFLSPETYNNNQLCFKPLKEVQFKQERKPPRRGWCYINNG